MDKLLEKKNFGIPVTILTVFAYLIGYAVTTDFANLLVAVVFAGVVFAFPFDEKVRSAVKRSYMVSLIISIVYIGFDLLFQLSNLVTPPDNRYFILQSVFNNIYRYGLALMHIAVIVIFLILLLMALMNKDTKINLVDSMYGEGTPKPAPTFQQMPYQQQAQPMYQQPMPQPIPHPMTQPIQQPMPQPIPQPVSQPMYQGQMNPATQAMSQPLNKGFTEDRPIQGHPCPKCGMMNRPDASFCAACGTKL